MPHYDFIEIGTSNFKTLIEKADDNTVGISVEPLSCYLNQLPNKPKVIKENVAISLNNSTEPIEIYYIPEKVIYENDLPKWLRGCNSLNKLHKDHIRLRLQKHVVVEKVNQISISSLLEKHSVESIDLLKIDTEGGDCDILLNLKKYLVNKTKNYYPKKIKFETNSLTPSHKLKIVLDAYRELGYEKLKSTKQDTDLILE